MFAVLYPQYIGEDFPALGSVSWPRRPKFWPSSSRDPRLVTSPEIRGRGHYYSALLLNRADSAEGLGL